MVATAGMPVFLAKASISSRAPAETTPPPQTITGRFASPMAWAARLTCMGWPAVLGL